MFRDTVKNCFLRNTNGVHCHFISQALLFRDGMKIKPASDFVRVARLSALISTHSVTQDKSAFFQNKKAKNSCDAMLRIMWHQRYFYYRSLVQTAIKLSLRTEMFYKFTCFFLRFYTKIHL